MSLWTLQAVVGVASRKVCDCDSESSAHKAQVSTLPRLVTLASALLVRALEEGYPYGCTVMHVRVVCAVMFMDKHCHGCIAICARLTGT